MLINITRCIGSPIKISDDIEIIPIHVHGDEVQFKVVFLNKHQRLKRKQGRVVQVK